ncbi:MAG: EVE domain-containing protein [Gemmataceae bacterium]|nr:EVE domain-containing protein [Gemmataceae bacterium]
MASWLFKQEPDCYSFAQLEADGSTLWDGVTNNLARKHLRQVAKGDRILYYHTGKEKAIVGEMKAVSAAVTDADGDDPKAVILRVKPVRRWKSPVSLERIKKDASLANWDLVRNSRLSVMPVTDAQWQRVEELAGESE